jgi:hypothetical protein
MDPVNFIWMLNLEYGHHISVKDYKFLIDILTNWRELEK